MKFSKHLFTLSFLCISICCFANTALYNLDECHSDVISFDSHIDFQTHMNSLQKRQIEFKDAEYDILSLVLNEDHITKIADYYIKIDVPTESVFVLESKFENQYNDLVAQNLDNTNIQQFSVNDNILSLLFEGATNEEACYEAPACTPVPYDTDYDSASSGSHWLNASAIYRAYGVYNICYVIARSSSYIYFEEWDISYQTTSGVWYQDMGEYEDGDMEDWQYSSYFIYGGYQRFCSLSVYCVYSGAAGEVNVILG